MTQILDVVGRIDWPQVGIWAGLALLLVVPGAICVWIARRLGARSHLARIEELETRLANLSSAVSLLTDTTESAFRDVMSEIERLSRTPAASPFDKHASVQRRMSVAARNGRSVRDIAVSEGVSEGEARLRLRLVQDQRPDRTAQAMGE